MKTHSGKQPVVLSYPLDGDAKRWFYHSFELPDNTTITNVECILSGVDEVMAPTPFGTIVINTTSYPNVWGVKVQAEPGATSGSITFRFTTAVSGDAGLGEIDDRTVRFSIRNI
jgi:hypothetical protein